MINLPKEIYSIEGDHTDERWTGNVLIPYVEEHNYYIINRGLSDQVDINFVIPRFDDNPSRKNISFEIIDNSREFVNGFKLVQTSNLEYAYLREEDNKLLPYRYEVATDFNKYGYAMVGKYGMVSWIDRDFRILDKRKERFMPYEFGCIHSSLDHYNDDMFSGFRCISQFSKGKNPLSRVERINNHGFPISRTDVSYLGIDGTFKNFLGIHINGIGEPWYNEKYFNTNSTDFANKDYAFANYNELLLLSSGYCLNAKDLVEFCNKYGTLENIINEVNEKPVFNQASFEAKKLEIKRREYYRKRKK